MLGAQPAGEHERRTQGLGLERRARRRLPGMARDADRRRVAHPDHSWGRRLAAHK